MKNSEITVRIPIPFYGKKIAEDFYIDKIGMSYADGKLKIENYEKIFFCFEFFDEIVGVNLSFENSSMFSIPIKTNMLSTCKMWLDEGVDIVYLQSNPGGYNAIIKDPFGNEIEFYCDNWDDVDKEVYPFDWIFFKKLD